MAFQNGSRPPFRGQKFSSEPTSNAPLTPGDNYLLPPSRFQKKAFPFVTPLASLKKNLGGQLEERARPVEPETLRVIPFGGVEQVGLNCMGFEYEDEVLVIDMGIQFADQYQFGANSSVPDLTYLKGKKCVGVAITHGHIDHIGAISVVMRQIGQSVPLYATPMAYELIKMKQEEIKYPLQNLTEYVRYKPVQMGKHFIITPFTVDHSIPDSVGLLIETPVGRFVHTGDWKFDAKPLANRPSTDYEFLAAIGKRGCRALFSDSTNAHLLGSSVSESEVISSIEDIFEIAKGRIITATFSSIVDRVILMIMTSEKYGRKVVLLGRSMQNYMEIAMKLGYARPKPGTMITMEEANKLPENEVTICCTGAQGERYAALMRIATGESKDTSLRQNDTIVFSSSVIPGNERAVQGIYDVITQQGCRVHHYKESEIHAGGHARAEDSKKMIEYIKPEVYVPIYGYPHMLFGNARNAKALGYSDDNIVLLKNGNILEFTAIGFRKTEAFVPHRLISVDGNMIGYTREDTFHERHQLMVNGVISLAISLKNNRLSLEVSGLPELALLPGKFESRLKEAALGAAKTESQNRDLDPRHIEKAVEKRVGDMFFNELAKEPIVIVHLTDGVGSGESIRPNMGFVPKPNAPAPRAPQKSFPPRPAGNTYIAPPRTPAGVLPERTAFGSKNIPQKMIEPSHEKMIPEHTTPEAQMAHPNPAAVTGTTPSATRFVGSFGASFGGGKPTPRPQPKPFTSQPLRSAPPTPPVPPAPKAESNGFSEEEVGI